MTRYYIHAGQSDLMVVNVHIQGRALQIHLPCDAIRNTFGATEGFLPCMRAVRDHLPAIARVAAARADPADDSVRLAAPDLFGLRTFSPGSVARFSAVAHESRDVTCNP
ncbi:MAG TPA: hypothetical protein VFY22_06950, partial [Hydrogenophaga sp.]|nr:hypothetical protein [Hydrogenophaga sp.]